MVGSGVERLADPPTELVEVGCGECFDGGAVEVGLDGCPAGSQVGEPVGVVLNPLAADGLGERVGPDLRCSRRGLRARRRR